MTTIINETTAPWILGGLGVLVLITLVRIVSTWRRVKRSPYFFLRQQAERRLRNHLWTTFGVFVLGGVVLFYGNQMPPDHTIRMAVIASAKPVAELVQVTSPDELPVIDLSSPPAFEAENGRSGLTATTTITNQTDLTLTGLDGLALPTGDPILPDEFDLIEPEVEMSEEASFTNLVFSTEINDEYDPVSPRRTFVAGFFTIYATFDYVGMDDGLAWSWIWRRNGEVINGGNELWQYADDGPGWIYFEPPEGYEPGQYTLDVWVNGELFQQGSFVVESEAANR